MKFLSLLLVIILSLVSFSQVRGQTPEPTAYDTLNITTLRERTYGSGEIRIEEVLENRPTFTRYLISYPSDGLTVYGFMNVPKAEGQFPVIIAIHGYVDPLIYNTLDYTTRYADSLVEQGYLVLHPNLRDYWPSDMDNTDGLFRVGYAVDVLNLVALVKSTGGQVGALEQANPNAIGLWGHSMGGGISLRVITVTQAVQAAVLYGAMSGNERKNYEKILEWSGDFGLRELETPDEALVGISPIYHLDWVETPISVHHGLNDESVPYDWSVELCNELFILGKPFECFFYENQPHTFQGSDDALFIERMVAFYDTYLK